MKKTIIVKITKQGAIYVNDILMRTRSHKTTLSNKDAAGIILRRLIRVFTSSDVQLRGQVYEIEVSDEEMSDSKVFYAESDCYEKDNRNYNSYKYNFSVSYDYVMFPCTYWFKKLTGWDVRPTPIWMKVKRRNYYSQGL